MSIAICATSCPRKKSSAHGKSSDRLLVAVSASPYSERLIRYARRLAASMEASWIVANIEGYYQLSFHLYLRNSFMNTATSALLTVLILRYKEAWEFIANDEFKP